jgi:hypothetical protein
MRQAAKLALGLLLIAGTAFGMAVLVVWYFAIARASAGQVYGIFTVAAIGMILLCLLGERLRIRALAYYLVAGAVPFLGADILLSLRFDIMMGPKWFQDGLVPATIVGLFLGGFYGMVTGRDAGGHRPPVDPPWR